jgi:hypothetical protein
MINVDVCIKQHFQLEDAPSMFIERMERILVAVIKNVYVRSFFDKPKHHASSEIWADTFLVIIRIIWACCQHRK